MQLLSSLKGRLSAYPKFITLAFVFSYIYHPDYAQNASKLTVSDTRSTTTVPHTYTRGVTADFKINSVMGLPTTSVYYTVLGINGWGDDSGGPSHELAFSNTSDIYIRTGFISSGWGAWEKILTDRSIKTLSNGNVLIGKTGQTNSNYKLDVNGDMRVNQIVVNTTGADFVFSPSYCLISLDSLENYIKENHHLPGIPTAIDMRNGGVNLGELSNTLLAKVEELTKYIIEQKKLIDLQNNKIDSLEKQYVLKAK